MSDTRLVIIVSVVVFLLFAIAMIAMTLLTITGTSRHDAASGSVNTSVVTNQSPPGSDKNSHSQPVTRVNVADSAASGNRDQRSTKELSSVNSDVEADATSRNSDLQTASDTPGGDLEAIISESVDDEQVDFNNEEVADLSDDNLEQGNNETDNNTEQDTVDDDDKDAEADNDDDSEPKGDLNLAGRVIDDSGNGLAGIVVFVRASGKGLDKALRVVTGDSGNFSVANLTAGDYLLQSQATATFQSASKTARAGVTTVTLPVSRNALSTVQGVVVNTNQQPLTNAVISHANSGASVKSDQQGRFLIRVNTANDEMFVLNFRAAGYIEKIESIDPAKQGNAGNIRRDVVMETSGDFSLTGTVTDENINAIERAVVTVDSTQLGITESTETNAEGSFSVVGLRPGSDYTVSVIKNPDYEPLVQYNYELSGTTEIPPIVLNSKRTGLISGRVRSPDNSPISNFTFTAYGDKLGKSIKSGTDGEYSFATIAKQVKFINASNADVRIDMTGPSVAVEETKELDIVINMGPYSFEGVVVDTATQLPVQNAAVQIQWQVREAELSGTVTKEYTTSADGIYRFANLGAGNWALTVTASNYSSYSQPVDPVSGQPRVELVRN